MTKKNINKKIIQHRHFKLTDEEHIFLLDLLTKKKVFKINTIFIRQGIFDLINDFLNFKLSTPLPTPYKKTIGVYFYEEEKLILEKMNEVCKKYNINQKDLLHQTIQHLMKIKKPKKPKKKKCPIQNKKQKT